MNTYRYVLKIDKRKYYSKPFQSNDVRDVLCDAIEDEHTGVFLHSIEGLDEDGTWAIQ